MSSPSCIFMVKCTILVWVRCTYAYWYISWAILAPSALTCHCWWPSVLEFWTSDCVTTHASLPFTLSKMYLQYKNISCCFFMIIWLSWSVLLIFLQLEDCPLNAKIRRNERQEIEEIPKMTVAAAEATTAQLKESTMLALQNSSLRHRALKVPVTSLVTSPLSTCREVTTSLTSSRIHSRGLSLLEVPKSDCNSSKSEDISCKCNNELLQKPKTQIQRAGANDANKGLAVVAAQNRKTLWLLTYIALVTTCPLIGSALLFRWRGKITAFTKRLLK